MSTDPQPTLEELFPLPQGIKLHTPKFGTNPVSPLVPAPVGGSNDDFSAPRPEFTIHWEDQQLELTVVVREREDGHLIAEVSCTKAGLLDTSAVSVGLVGTSPYHLLRKTIPLKGSKQSVRCGSADFGPLTDAVRELGPQLGVLVFLLV